MSLVSLVSLVSLTDPSAGLQRTLRYGVYPSFMSIYVDVWGEIWLLCLTRLTVKMVKNCKVTKKVRERK